VDAQLASLELPSRLSVGVGSGFLPEQVIQFRRREPFVRPGISPEREHILPASPFPLPPRLLFLAAQATDAAPFASAPGPQAPELGLRGWLATEPALIAHGKATCPHHLPIQGRMEGMAPTTPGRTFTVCRSGPTASPGATRGPAPSSRGRGRWARGGGR